MDNVVELLEKELAPPSAFLGAQRLVFERVLRVLRDIEKSVDGGLRAPNLDMILESTDRIKALQAIKDHLEKIE